MAGKTPRAIPARARERTPTPQAGGQPAPQPSMPSQMSHLRQLHREGGLPPPPPPAVGHTATEPAPMMRQPQRRQHQRDRPQGLQAEARPPPMRRRCARQRGERGQTADAEARGVAWWDGQKTYWKSRSLVMTAENADAPACVKDQLVATDCCQARSANVERTNHGGVI